MHLPKTNLVPAFAKFLIMFLQSSKNAPMPTKFKSHLLISNKKNHHIVAPIEGYWYMAKKELNLTCRKSRQPSYTRNLLQKQGQFSLHSVELGHLFLF